MTTSQAPPQQQVQPFLTISAQFDLASKAHDTASATARATMLREMRDRRGRWARTPGGASPALAGNAIHEHLGSPPLNKSQRDTLARYQSTLYHQMDAYLNTGDIHAADDEMGSHVISEPEMKKQVALMGGAFKAAGPTSRPVTVYRGMTVPDATPGATWTDKTPVSTSTDRAIGDQFRRYAESGQAKLVRITVPAGSSAISMMNLLGKQAPQAVEEKEILLPPGSRFRVTAASGNIVEAELLPNSTPAAIEAANPQPPPQQVPPGQQPPPPPPQSDGLDDAALALALATLLVTAVSAAAVIAALRVRFVLSSAAWQALGGVLGDVMQTPPPMTGVIGNASAQTSRMNAARRAQYVLAATKRTVTAMREARSQGKPVLGAMKDQLATERRFYAQHKQAMWNRATAAGKIDMEAATWGPLLGWYAKHDKRVTAECLKAHGSNFYVSDPPDIGLPGIGPHVGCRCEAGAPWPGGKLLPSRRASYRKAALWPTRHRRLPSPQQRKSR